MKGVKPMKTKTICTLLAASVLLCIVANATLDFRFCLMSVVPFLAAHVSAKDARDSDKIRRRLRVEKMTENTQDADAFEVQFNRERMFREAERFVV